MKKAIIINVFVLLAYVLVIIALIIVNIKIVKINPIIQNFTGMSFLGYGHILMAISSVCSFYLTWISLESLSKLKRMFASLLAPFLLLAIEFLLIIPLWMIHWTLGGGK